MSKILVVDDLKDITDVMSLLFDALGHETRIAGNGQEAVELARSFHPEIVFMDLDMPVLNGFEAARAIRASALAYQPYLIALTATRGVTVEVATRAVGFDFFLHKPADTNALLALVDDLSNRQRLAS